jgi:hypothetical protein
VTVETLNPMVALLERFWTWLCAGGCQIKGRDGAIVALQPNQLQREMQVAMLAQAEAGQPIRIVILKSRKMGCSTFIQALAYFLVKECPHIYAQIVAHTDPSTRDIYEIAARMYVLDPAWSQRPKWPADSRIDFRDEHDSQLNIRTFGGHYVSSSANIQLLHVSELAKVPGDGNFVRDQMASMNGSVSDMPNTFVFLESTANRADESHEFERRYRTAALGVGSYRAVFSPWYDEPTYRLKLLGELPALEDAAAQAAEDELRTRVPWLDDAQLAWRRAKIADLGSPRLFAQEYPTNPEEAFQKAEGLIFSGLKLATHNWSAAVEELVAGGYELYRGFDWGGTDPFVTVWVAHQPRLRSRFSLDVSACPQLWDELTHWSYDDRGKPRDRNNHGLDALRYVVTQFNLSGHVHVWQEFFDPDFAVAGRWIQDNAQDAKRLSGNWSYAGSVGDRGRPDCLAAFINQGIPLVGYGVEGVSGRPGEIQYGIDRLNQLIVANFPIEYDPPPPSVAEVHRRRRERTGLSFGYGSLEALQTAMQQRTTPDGVRAEVPCGAW